MPGAVGRAGDSPSPKKSPDEPRERAARFPCVLVVDDDPGIREAIAAVLRDERYIVATAGNGQRALDMMRGGLRPALVILDLWMPVLDGEQTLSAMKDDATLHATPVIVISAALEKRKTDAVASAALAMKKPLDLEELLSVVDALTSRDRAH